jgi:hypothetical protein
MPPFPPSIVNALLREPLQRASHQEPRELPERFERSRFRSRRLSELRARQDASRVTVPARPASDVTARKAA